MKNILYYLIVLVLFSGCGNTGPDLTPASLLAELNPETSPNQLSSQENKKGWQLLSDGKTFANWHGFNMDEAPDCWVMEDGAFKVLTEGGAESNKGLASDKVYRSFALSLEFKLDTATNSGILYQVAEDPKYHYAYETGPEYQVIDHENWPNPLEDWQTCGANYAMHPPLSDPSKPVGEWNHAFLVVNGNRVTHMLNGEVVVEYEKYSDEWTELRNSGKWNDFPDYGKYDEGNIVLQNHSTVVWYRDIKIKELTADF